MMDPTHGSDQTLSLAFVPRYQFGVPLAIRLGATFRTCTEMNGTEGRMINYANSNASSP